MTKPRNLPINNPFAGLTRWLKCPSEKYWKYLHGIKFVDPEIISHWSRLHLLVNKTIYKCLQCCWRSSCTTANLEIHVAPKLTHSGSAMPRIYSWCTCTWIGIYSFDPECIFCWTKLLLGKCLRRSWHSPQCSYWFICTAKFWN